METVKYKYRKKRFPVKIKFRRDRDTADSNTADSNKAYNKALRWMRDNWPRFRYERFRRSGVLKIRGGQTGRYYRIDFGTVIEYREFRRHYRTRNRCILNSKFMDPNHSYHVHIMDRFPVLYEYVVHHEALFRKTARINECVDWGYMMKGKR